MSFATTGSWSPRIATTSSSFFLFPVTKEIVGSEFIVNNIKTTATNNNKTETDTKIITLIDFGLSSTSLLIEDRAVDLYVLERSFLATHPNTQKLFDILLNAYVTYAENGSKVLQKLFLVRQRGRKRQMIG